MIEINDKEKMCYIDERKVELSPLEYKLLAFFLNSVDTIFSREEIIEKVWGKKVSSRTIDTNIVRLRKKLGKYSKYLITRRGFGYGLVMR